MLYKLYLKVWESPCRTEYDMIRLEHPLYLDFIRVGDELGFIYSYKDIAEIRRKDCSVMDVSHACKTSPRLMMQIELADMLKDDSGEGGYNLGRNCLGKRILGDAMDASSLDIQLNIEPDSLLKVDFLGNIGLHDNCLVIVPETKEGA